MPSSRLWVSRPGLAAVAVAILAAQLPLPGATATVDERAQHRQAHVALAQLSADHGNVEKAGAGEESTVPVARPEDMAKDEPLGGVESSEPPQAEPVHRAAPVALEPEAEAGPVRALETVHLEPNHHDVPEPHLATGGPSWEEHRQPAAESEGEGHGASHGVAGAHASGGHREGEAHEVHDHCHHHVKSHALDDEMAVTMILLLIALTIGFEKAKHELDHGRSESERLVVNALFGEVTVLGFIALVTFFLIKSGFFEFLSIRYYDDEQHLLHLFEDVHFGLFFTMMLYLLLVMWVLYVQGVTKASWKNLEEQTKKYMRDNALLGSSTKGPRTVSSTVKQPSLPMPRDEYLEWRYNGGGRIPVGFDGVIKGKDNDLENGEVSSLVPHEIPEVHQYSLLRARFIWGLKNGEGRRNTLVDNSFDFGRYLDNCLAKLLTNIVIVHEVTWFVIALFMLLCYVVFSHMGRVGSCYAMAGLGALLVAAMLWMWFTVYRIMQQLSPPPDTTLKHVLSGNRMSAPAYESLAPDKLMSKHAQLFPFRLGEYGPMFLEHFLRTTLLLAAIYLVGVLVVFLPLMFAEQVSYLFPICMLSVLVTMWMVIPVLGRLTIITSVGLLKNKDVIEETNREVKLERSIKIIKILAAIQSQANRLKNLRGKDSDAPKKEAKTIDPKQRQDLYEAFKLFDEDNSGFIDSKELYNLLISLGMHVEPAEAERMLREMDSTDDGQVNFDEFVAVMAQDDDASAANVQIIAREMFKMLDKDNSQTITLGEFREFLRGLPIDLSTEDVDNMLHDIFGDDDDASITPHEFEHFLSQHNL